MPSDYEVGYGKPPRHGRFAKGQSGNPRGRPKGTKNLKTDLSEELRERVLVREGGSTSHLSKQRALVKSLVTEAIQGDQRAASTVLNMMLRLLDDDEAPVAGESLGKEDQEVYELLRRRTRGFGESVGNDGGSSGSTAASGSVVPKVGSTPSTKTKHEEPYHGE